MPKVLISSKNPFGLTLKQTLVIWDLVNTIKRGDKIDAPGVHMKYYNVKKRSTASVMANQNLKKLNFLNALHSMLENEGVFGVSGKLVRTISEGLDAVQVLNSGKEIPDYNIRLEYIKEINKIAGIY